MSEKTPEQMRALLRKACDAAGSQRQWADENGFSEQYVCDILLGRREISEAVAATLGYSRIVTFRLKRRALEGK